MWPQRWATPGSAAPAANCIDDNDGSACVGEPQVHAWVSVQIPAGSSVGYVSIVNNDGGGGAALATQEWLSPFEVWVGEAASARLVGSGRRSSNAERSSGISRVREVSW